MLVELYKEEEGEYYILLESGFKWFIDTPSAPFKRFTIQPEGVIEVPNYRELGALEPNQVVELSKAGIRVDDIIKLRQVGIL